MFSRPEEITPKLLGPRHIDGDDESRQVMPSPEGVGARLEPRNQAACLSGELFGYLRRHFPHASACARLIVPHLTEPLEPEYVNKRTAGFGLKTKFLLEHKLPKRLRYAKMYLEAGSASVFFSLDGTNADWHASIGRKKEGVQMTDREYSRLRASVQAVQTLDEDGRMASSRTRRAAKSSG